MEYKPIKVLLVEDNEADYVLTRSLFLRAGPERFKLEWVRTYNAGLEAVVGGTHDVCLVDYRLGGSSGLNFLREAAERGCEAPIILLTAQGDDKVDREAMEAGAADYLEKGSIDEVLLERTIRYAVKQRQAEEALQEAHDELERRSESLQREVAERKRVEAASQVSRDNLHSLVEKNPEGILIVDKDGIVRFANSSAISLLDRRKEDLLDGIFGLAQVTGEMTEVNIVRFGQEPGWAEMRMDETEWKGESAYLVLFHDITDRKRAEEALEQKAEELARSNAELEQFAYVASHDLQEPLRMVSSYMQLLERRYKDQLDSDASEFIAFAVDGATRMQRLIKDLLVYSRVGTKGKEFAPTDCETIFEQAMTNVQIAFKESGGQMSHDPLPVVMADDVQLGQLFQNLIGNALKFHGDQPPCVQVSAEQKENQWIFSFTDKGIGIDPEFSDRIFEIFQRLHSREEYSGTGIGLAVCKKIVERHGGRIWMKSKPREGTTFYFTIPMLKEYRDERPKERYVS